jgi:hypothetical protein
MYKRHPIGRAVHYALMVGVGVTAVGYASAASAANVNTPAKLRQITVTGTHIKRTNIET